MVKVKENKNAPKKGDAPKTPRAIRGENKHEIDAVLNKGAEMARKIADRMMTRVKKAVLG